MKDFITYFAIAKNLSRSFLTKIVTKNPKNIKAKAKPPMIKKNLSFLRELFASGS